MANYKVGEKVWSFTAPEDTTGLPEALQTVNPEDRDKIEQFYRSMTIDKEVEVKDAGKTKMMPWPSAMFDHAQVVAAAAMFTALKVDAYIDKILSGYL